MDENNIQTIYDAKKLGIRKMILFGFQHLFGMFGATVLVPALTGLDVQTALFFAGLCTILMHLITSRKVPVFLGSSFAFIAGYAAIAPNGEQELLPYACFGVMLAGLVYVVVGQIIRKVGVNRVMRFFPPLVTGPIIIAIGLNLAGSAINNCSTNWGIALVAIISVLICNIKGKGMIKIIPILIGIAVSYLVAIIFGKVDFTPVKDAAWIGLPIHSTVFSIFGSTNFNSGLLISAIIAILPISISTMLEHIGDIKSISDEVGKDFLKDPGLWKTLTADGLCTSLASVFLGPANTTYGENTGVLALTKIYDPLVMRIGALFAILISFSPKVSAVITCMPTATIGGISLVLYSMIAGIGFKNIKKSNINLDKIHNMIIMVLIVVVAVGVNYSSDGAININIGAVTIPLSGLAIASVLGIVLNALVADKDYVFTEDEKIDDMKKF